MRRYDFVFLDIDDTILDFQVTESVAYRKALALHGVEPTDELLARYHLVNISWWEKLERGEVDRDELLVARHRQLFEERGLQVDPVAFEADYLRFLGMGHYFVDGAPELLAFLHDKGCRLFIASNGVAATQYSRLESAGIGKYFEQIFISETTGFHKPDPRYFRFCFDRIPGFVPERAILIGDSLSSDIQGAKNVGIASCWFNRSGRTAPPDLAPDYEITALDQVKGIL